MCELSDNSRFWELPDLGRSGIWKVKNWKSWVLLETRLVAQGCDAHTSRAIKKARVYLSPFVTLGVYSLSSCVLWHTLRFKPKKYIRDYPPPQCVPLLFSTRAGLWSTFITRIRWRPCVEVIFVGQVLHSQLATSDSAVAFPLTSEDSITYKIE